MRKWVRRLYEDVGVRGGVRVSRFCVALYIPEIAVEGV
jgi:hypothetical protein